MFFLHLFLYVSVIVIMVAQFFNHNYENVFLCLLTLVLFTLPAAIEKKLRIRFPSTMEVVILLFIYAAEVLGEIHSMYTRVPAWDTILHALNGFLMAAIGFSLVELLNRNDSSRMQLSPVYLAIVAFCFSMTIGVCWEFLEFGSDYLFQTDMQKDTLLTKISSVSLNPEGLNRTVVVSDIEHVVIRYSQNGEVLLTDGYLDIGLYDTMEDLFVNFIGAGIFSIIGYFHISSKGRDRKGRLAEKFIPKVYGRGNPPERIEKDIDKKKTLSYNSHKWQ